MEGVNSKIIILWRAILSFIATLFINTIISGDFYYYIVIYVLILIASFFLITNKKMQIIIKVLMDEKFNTHLKELYKYIAYCLLITFLASGLVIVIVYESSPDTPTSLITATFFFLPLSAIYLLKFLKGEK